MHACISCMLTPTHPHTPHYTTPSGDTAADYDIENEDLTLIWAFGQVYPEYHHRLLSDAEFNNTQNQRFFPVDQLKYHGGKNRGGTIINFFEADNGMH